MRKQILVDGETRAFLQKSFGCSRQLVWMALNYVRDSDQARRIRSLALERGGKLTGDYAPRCETIFGDGGETMTCAFGSRVRVVVCLKTSVVETMVDGERKERYENLSVADFMQVQYEAQRLAAAL